MSPLSLPSSSASRRTVLRAAAWTAPAVSVAVAAPAFAVSGEASVDTAWALTADPDIAYANPGDLTWTVRDADLLAGSTVTLVIRDTNGTLEGYAWLEALDGLAGRAIGSIAVAPGGSTTITLTTTADVPVGSTFGLTIGPENSSSGAYAIDWTIDPANPSGANLTGTVSWSASSGFSQS